MTDDISGFSTETQIAPEVGTSETQPTTTEFDVDRVDNIGQLRDHVKGLKTDLETYKSTHNFVEESFGDLENAKLAQQLYSGFVSEEFEPEEFYNIIQEVSPSRAQALAQKFAERESLPIAYEKVKELFGGEVTPDEVALFRQWRDSGYMITNEEDIPEAFKYDSYGNPLSEEQVDAFREQFKMLNNLRSQVETQVSATQQKYYEEQVAQEEYQKQEKINEFDTSNLKVLENDLAKVGLTMSESDTPEVRKYKEYAREFIIGGIGRMFLGNQQYAKDYQTAIAHLQSGEERLARRYEPRIQKALLDIVRSEPISKLISSFAPDEPRRPRPEISNSGVSSPTMPTEGGSREDRIRNLIATGAIKP